VTNDRIDPIDYFIYEDVTREEKDNDDFGDWDDNDDDDDDSF